MSNNFEPSFRLIDEWRGRGHLYDPAVASAGRPPAGYIVGLKMEYDADLESVFVTAGTANVLDLPVDLPARTQISPQQFVWGLIASVFYYVYMTPDGDLKVDSLPPAYSEDQFSFYHQLKGWRALGRLYVDEDVKMTWAASDYR